MANHLKKKIWKAAALSVLLFISSHLVSAEGTQPKITAVEYKEARALAKKFYKRLIDTKDIKPLIREFYVKDFQKRVQKNFRDWSIVLNGQYPEPVPPRERRRQLIKLYESENNFMVLCMLYANSLYYENGSDSIDLMENLPLDVKAVLKKHEALVAQIYEDDSAPKASHYDRSSLEFFDMAMTFYDEVIPLLRKADVKINAGRNKHFEPNIKEITEWMDAFKPWVFNHDDYMGLPKGTRVINVNIPYFQLTLVKENKHLRVVNCIIYID